ncbi:MAG: LysE family translocator [Boseongicola sp.]|nr:MAG: LysE family translocator [Boseongicola sp.]
MTLTALLTLAGLQALIAISPGPAAVLTIKTAASEGVRAGLAISLGLAIAIVIWASAALAGLSLIFEVAPFLQTTLRFIGAAFLIWIAISMWRHAPDPMPEAKTGPETSLSRLVRLGIYTDLANPKALAYFTAVFTGLLPIDPTLRDAALILVTVFTVEFIWYATVSAVFSRDTPRRAYGAAKSWLDRVFGGILALLGIRIALP